MDHVDELIHSILSHETIYDPVKAHEYYLKTRELKGRQSTQGFTETQKQGLSFVKSEISKRKKAEFDTAKEAFKQIQEGLLKRRQELQKKLQSIMGNLTGSASTSRENILKNAQAKIDSLPKVPEGIPEARRQKLLEQRRTQIAQIRGEANKNLKSLTESTRANAEKARGAVDKERQSVQSELKGSLDKAREDYKKLRENIKAKYEAELDKEYNAIRSNVR